MIKNTGKHFKTICIHKYYVFKYCKAAGIPWRGIKHDLSKFSPVEFFESAKYYQGTSSPIDACKKENGYSLAWQHHKGRNTHHYEYWQDNFDKGGTPLQMPFDDALEMLCDYLGAGHAYMGKDFTYLGELKWWLNKNQNPLAMHPQTRLFVSHMLYILAQAEVIGIANISMVIKKFAKREYERANSEVEKYSNEYFNNVFFKELIKKDVFIITGENL